MEGYPIKQCVKCNRFDDVTMKQKNHLYCLFKCEPYGRACLSAAFAYNKSVSGDPNIYGIDGTVWKPKGE